MICCNNIYLEHKFLHIFAYVYILTHETELTQPVELVIHHLFIS